MDLCRQKGVIKLARSSDGAVELLMGPAPTEKTTKEEKKDSRGFRRDHYTNLFGRPVIDAELDMLP